MNFDKMKVLNSKDPFEICILVYSIHFKLNVFKETDKQNGKLFAMQFFWQSQKAYLFVKQDLKKDNDAL